MLQFQILFFCFIYGNAINVDVEVDLKVVRQIDPTKFLSITIDSQLPGRHNFCNISWDDAVTLAKAFEGSYLRFGGGDADWMYLANSSETETQSKNKKPYCYMFEKGKFTITKAEIDRLVWFAKESKLRLIYDLNQFTKKPDGSWNPAETIRVLDYLSSKGYEMDFELGNEPDLYHAEHKINGEQVAENYKKLHTVLKKYPLYHKSKVLGIEAGASWKHITASFLNNGGIKLVDAVTYHHYYGGPGTKLHNFIDPKWLDGVKYDIHTGVDTVKKYSAGMKNPPQIWFGETSTTYGGGVVNLSDSYAAGFMWLDKLGLCALMGFDLVARQTFYQGNYALVDYNTRPNPDYWLSVLYKRLVGPNVLIAYVNAQENKHHNYLRFYAHTNDTSITIYGMNLLNETADITFGKLQGKVHQYLLTPNQNDLLSRKVMLNGEELIFEGQLPPLLGKMTKQPVKLPAKTFGFWVFPAR